MTYAKRLSHAYHDAGLVSASVGPRREIGLVVRLDPVWNNGLDKECTVRLGAVRNFEEVAAFVRALTPPERGRAYLDQVLRLDWNSDGNVDLELERHGFIEVMKPKVMEI
jgi:hypothetical protein